MQIKSFTFNPFMENTYVLYSKNKGVIIDPGCYDPAEEKELKDFIAAEDIEIEKLLNTHGHIDHVLGNTFVKDQFNVSLWIGEHDVETLKTVQVYAPNYGFQKYRPAEPDYYLKEGDTVKFGDSQLEVIFAPGHAPGHIAFYNKSENILIGGDVLFRESIGRTDLPGGDHDTLIESIHSKLFKLPDNTKVYCGHGESTTIGHEKQFNPFCALR